MSDEIVKRGRGRPKKVDGKRIDFWLGVDDIEILEDMSKTSGQSKSEICREAIRGYCAYVKAVEHRGK